MEQSKAEDCSECGQLMSGRVPDLKQTADAAEAEKADCQRFPEHKGQKKAAYSTDPACHFQKSGANRADCTGWFRELCAESEQNGRKHQVSGNFQHNAQTPTVAFVKELQGAADSRRFETGRIVQSVRVSMFVRTAEDQPEHNGGKIN